MGLSYSPPATLSEAGAPPLPPHFLPTAERSVEDLPQGQMALQSGAHWSYLASPLGRPEGI